VNKHHVFAEHQLDAISDMEWPEPQGDSDGLVDYESRNYMRIGSACHVGALLALVSMSQSLCEIAELLKDGPPRGQAAATLGTQVSISRKEIQPMPALSPLTVDTNSNITYQEAPKDAAGNTVADSISFSSSDPAVLELTAAPDGLSALAVTKAPGAATVTITDGVNTDSQDVTVTSGAPVSLGTTATVVPKA
jgi:hypothetical protein